MSSLIVRMRKQKAVFWKRSTTTDSYGEFTYDPPIEISCRWQDSQAQVVSRRDTRSAISDSPKHTDESVVYVDREVLPGDVLLLGTVSTLPATLPADPRQIPGAVEVKRLARTPNIRNTETLLKVYL